MLRRGVWRGARGALPGGAPEGAPSAGSRAGSCALALTAAARAEQVSAAEVTVEQKPWARTSVGGQPHDHGACTSREHNISTARYSV